ncbi:MAG: helix-turn-helix transcriptional regulator [Candidatus Kerfeldbacteria bacterium]|nr:helix-turn-helix transcriptional regulator [Candidatus Kerfeldbacteria bacterium]
MHRVRNRVYELRQAKSIRQEDLAHHVGVTRQTIIAIEGGNYTPSVALALRIAHFFKKHVDEVFYF